MVLSDSHSARSLNDIIITLSEPDLTPSLHYIVTYLPSYVGDSILLCLKNNNEQVMVSQSFRYQTFKNWGDRISVGYMQACLF